MLSSGGKADCAVLFETRDGTSGFALNNYDPIGKANVLSRGIIGSLSGEPVVASPLYKEHYSLKTGQCLEDESVAVDVFAVRLNNHRVEIQA